MLFKDIKNGINALLIPILGVVLTYIALLYFQKFPDKIEILYTNPIYQLMLSEISILTGWLPFSLAELLVFIHLCLLGIAVIWLLKQMIFNDGQGIILMVSRTLGYVAILYCLFMWLWGFNYVQTPLAQRLQFDTTMLKNTELEAMCLDLVTQANQLRETTHQSNNLFTLPYSKNELMLIAKRDLQQDGDLIDFPSHKFGPPKPVLMSGQMLYTGITGIYFPFTGEANINVAAPDLLLPATALHEMAHQWGYASEDEANFVAYLASQAHTSVEFQYSGQVLALIYSVNALQKYDPEAAKRVRAEYGSGLITDLNNQRIFWAAYEGKVSKAADKMNDRYLKFNGQPEGVESYGRMVDLMIGYWRLSTNGNSGE